MNLPPVDRAQLVATRRDLHQHPELGFEERRTGTLVAERLKALGYSVRTGVGKTGVVGMRDGATMATFTIRETRGGMVEVLDENRVIAIKNGSFSDHFDAWGVHLYRLPAKTTDGHK